MQMLTTEAAQAEIINKDFTSPETVPPLPSIDQRLQRLPQQAFWWWSSESLPWLPWMHGWDCSLMFHLPFFPQSIITLME